MLPSLFNNFLDSDFVISLSLFVELIDDNCDCFPRSNSSPSSFQVFDLLIMVDTIPALKIPDTIRNNPALKIGLRLQIRIMIYILEKILNKSCQYHKTNPYISLPTAFVISEA